MAAVAKSVIVTGAASGLGKAIATAFLKRGSTVTLVDINSDSLRDTSKELSALGSCLPMEANIADEKAVESVFDKSVAHSGQVDALVNCAGVLDRFEGAGEVDPNLWGRVMNVNCNAVYLMSRMAVRDFVREGRRDGRKGGAIVNISSMAGLRGGVSGAAYAASKAGVVGLTLNTAAYYAKQGIRCNAICPGGMATNMANSTKGDNHSIFGTNGWDMLTKLNDMNPGFVDIDRLGRLVTFLCSEDGLDINGAVISVDKGWKAI
ncbi:hypothetical protein FDECE_306 [Fusarium decemcellulare]|nr:hypothetical protein FDECE_306 [Fusarium decemcellulare]